VWVCADDGPNEQLTRSKRDRKPNKFLTENCVVPTAKRQKTRSPDHQCLSEIQNHKACCKTPKQIQSDSTLHLQQLFHEGAKTDTQLLHPLAGVECQPGSFIDGESDVTPDVSLVMSSSALDELVHQLTSSPIPDHITRDKGLSLPPSLVEEAEVVNNLDKQIPTSSLLRDDAVDAVTSLVQELWGQPSTSLLSNSDQGHRGPTSTSLSVEEAEAVKDWDLQLCTSPLLSPVVHEAGTVSSTQVQQPPPPSLAVCEAEAVNELEAQLPTSPSLAVEEAEAVDVTEEQAQCQHKMHRVGRLPHAKGSEILISGSVISEKEKKPKEKHTSIVLALPYQLRESFLLSANAASNVPKLSVMTLDLKYVQNIMH